MNRNKIFVNGYEYWVEEKESTLMFYDTETAKNGISIEDSHWSKDEYRQIEDYMKYRHPELYELYYVYIRSRCLRIKK